MIKTSTRSAIYPKKISPNHLYHLKKIRKERVSLSSPVTPEKSLPLIYSKKGHASIAMDGTSFAAPKISGAVFHMIEKNPSLTPEKIKKILLNIADDMGYPRFIQGAGRLNEEEAIIGT